MHEEFYRWFDKFVLSMNAELSSFSPRNSPTDGNERFRRYYTDGIDGKEHFVVHIKPVPTKKRANIMFGLKGSHFKIPIGCPELEFRTKSVPKYREYNLPMENEQIEIITLDLARQVAQHFTR